MTRLTFLVLAIAWTLGGCLPNPQSEWTSSAGGSQRSTLKDPTILAQSAPALPGGGIFDFDWGAAFSLTASDDDRGGDWHGREHARPTVQRFGAMSGGHSTWNRSMGGGSSGGGSSSARRR